MSVDDVYFAIKVDGVNLNEINPADLGLLLQFFSEALGSTHLYFDAITTGSTIAKLRTTSTFAAEKIARLNCAIVENRKEIMQIQALLDKHPEYQHIHFLKKSANDAEFIDLHTMDSAPIDKGMTFWQSEKLRGHLFKRLDGKDQTDHVGLVLENGIQVTMNCSRELSHALTNAWQSNELVEISGQAKYRYISYNDFKIEAFNAESFERLRVMSMNQWITDFVGDGESKWASMDDPVGHWLEERHG